MKMLLLFSLFTTLSFAQSDIDKAKSIADIKNNPGLSAEVKTVLINVLSGNSLAECEKEVLSGAERIVCPDGVYVKDVSVSNKSALDIIKEAQKAKALHEGKMKAGQQ